MRDYLERDPHLALSTHHTPVILARVRSGDALLGICAGRLPPGHGLDADLLLEEPFYLVGETQQSLPPASAESRRKILTMDLENPSNRYLREPLADLGLEPAMELDSYLALIELAKAGIGPVLLPLACWGWWENGGDGPPTARTGPPPASGLPAKQPKTRADRQAGERPAPTLSPPQRHTALAL